MGSVAAGCESVPDRTHPAPPRAAAAVIDRDDQVASVAVASVAVASMSDGVASDDRTETVSGHDHVAATCVAGTETCGAAGNASTIVPC